MNEKSNFHPSLKKSDSTKINKSDSKKELFFMKKNVPNT